MLRQSLQQKLLQKLSPQQIQLMKLLQVPTANLEERIKEEREKMLEKKKKRLDEQENLKKSQSQSRLAKKPLFQIFEEKFNTEIVMPELERRKEELKKKVLNDSIK